MDLSIAVLLSLLISVAGQRSGSHRYRPHFGAAIVIDDHVPFAIRLRRLVIARNRSCVVLAVCGSYDSADTENDEDGVPGEGDGHEDVGIHLGDLSGRLNSFHRDCCGLWLPKDDATLERQDRRDAAQGDESHGLIVRDDQDQWLWGLPGVRHPLNAPEMPFRPVNAIANSMF